MVDCGLTQSDIAAIQSLLVHQPTVSKAVLYGSRAMGNYRKGSDVDLTLIGDTLTQNDAMQLYDALDDSYLPYKFDISIKSLLKNENLVDHINRVGVVFYERSP